ncbi:MAG: hypothetical protein J1F43_02260 [Muribaculaceae bacterium]|nr:hypothetical protein [Muribaculaceae bacterium]
MKKLVLSIISTLALTSFALADEPNVMVIHYNDGSEAKVKIENIEHLEFLNLDDLSGFEDAKNPSASTDSPTDPGDSTEPGGSTDPELPETAPKVGDYFYSDGTWSDGGLVSIDPDGQNAVWSSTKPGPIEGKTVIGIVFNTNPDRISETEKAKGFTHGYVIGCKNITDPQKKNYSQYPESVWYASQYAYTNDLVQVNQVAKTAVTCYNNIEGYAETKAILENNEAEYYYTDIPMFYYGTQAYPVAAPKNTSGWYIPSVGQMWDCVANFCSGEVAKFLADNRTNSKDFTYYVSKNDLTSAAFPQFMKVFELVPDTDKDDMTIPDNGNLNNNTGTINLATSTRYDDETRVIISLGLDKCKLIEGMAAWFDEETHARPVLAF